MSAQDPGLYILVIDDDLAVLEMISSVLDDEGYLIRTAPSGPDGLAAIAASPPALVLLDWMMPRMQGDEVLRRIRAGPGRPIPVVILSANGDASTLLAEGADAFLAKPFDLDDLLACVARYLPRP